MEQRTFGDTDLVTSAIGFGTWEMSTTMYGDLDVAEASKAVNMAIDAGITLMDTAEVYGPWHSERLLADALGSRRDEIVLVTKVGFRYEPEDPSADPVLSDNKGKDGTRDNIIKSAEGCLQRLKTDHIDLLLMHWPDHKTPIAETIGAFEELKQAGKIRHYGVSNYSVAMMEEANRHGKIATNQVGYHIYDQRMDADVLPWCGANNVGFMGYGTLGFGLLTGAFNAATTFPEGDWRAGGKMFELNQFQGDPLQNAIRATARLAQLADGYGKSVAQLAIAWALGNPALTVGLVGMRNEKELAENVAAADWRLTDDDRAAITTILDEEGVPTHRDSPQALG
ncbi:MAG: putative oxidoreductase [Chloroflexi bacterium]|nr:MAG: putative oxidoreductase [Chloroflexota bacterium]